MKNIFLSVLFALFAVAGISQTVIISEYAEACSGSDPKALELWNPTAIDIDLTVTPITIEIQTNANSAWVTETVINTGMLLAGEVIVVSNASVGINGSTCATKENETLGHNGDDAFRITLGATVTDIFGDPSTTDPGTAWNGSGVSTRNSTIELNSGITTGNPAGFTDPSTRFQTVAGAACLTTGFGTPPGGCPVTLTPTITANPTSVSGLDYVLGAGPSGIDSIELSGSNLTGLVSGTAVTNFEFSLDKIVWAAFPGAISGAAINVLPVKVYVRLAASLPVATYSETLTLSSTGAANVDITLSGEVTAPVVVCTPTLQTLPYTGISGTAGFDHDSSNPPAAGPAEVCGTNFLLSYVNTPSTDGSDNEFGNQSNLGLTGLSSADFGGEGSFETYPIDVSGVTAVTVDGMGDTQGASVFNGASEELQWWYTLDGGAQMPIGPAFTADGSLDVNIPSLDVTGVNQLVVGFTFNINGQTDGFEDMDVTVMVPVANPPTITVGATSMAGFSYVFGAGPSATQGNTVEWANLTSSVTSGNVVNHFEFSGDAGATWNDATVLNVSIPPFPGTSPAAVPVLVRLKASLAVGNYKDTILLQSTGATSVEVYLDGNVTPAPPAACSDLFFSEYIEGSSNNKCLEIYNPTATAIDLAAGSYAIAVYGNGSTAPNGGAAVPLTGTVPAFGTFVICNAGATAAFTANADVVGGAMGAVTFYNGDDAVALEKGGVNIDVIGQIGFDPGSTWANNGVFTANQTLVRLAAIQAGDNVGSDVFDPSVEWTNFATDVATELGAHLSSCGPVIWTGTIDTDWQTAGNWSSNAVPTATDIVVIPTTPTGANFPVTGADVTIAGLTVETGATLDVGASFGLTLAGPATNNGTVTLKSDATGTAWLDEFTNATTYTGDITVETFVTAGSGLGQRYFGSAVSSSAVTGLDGTYTGYPLGQLIPTATCDPTQLDPASPYSNLFQWNENATFATSCVQEGWEAIGAGTSLMPGRAYSGWMNDGSVISVSGTPNTSDVVLPTSGATVAFGAPGYVANAHGWHLLANPFAAPLDVQSVITSGFTSPQTYDGGSGPFSGTFNPVLIGGTSLAVMQGFVAESTVGSTFTAEAADRIAGNAVWQKPDFTHMLEISVLGNGFGDRTYVYYDLDATNQFDPMGDCKKRESDAGHPTLYSDLNGDRMSLNGFALNSMDNSVGLGLMPGSNGSFTLTFDGIHSFPATSMIFLEDKLTGDFVNLRDNNAYTFQANTNDNSDRFEIHFTAPVTIETIAATCDGDDAKIVLDFGNNVVNNNTIAWDYTLSNNGLPINTTSNTSGAISIDGLEAGNYDLSLNIGNYSVDIPVEVLGLETVEADFNAVDEIEVGSQLTITNLSAGANTYEWTVEGVLSQNTDLTHTFVNTGLVEILLAASNDDCEASKLKTIKVVDKTTGIRNTELLEGANVYTQNGLIVVDLTNVNLSATTQVEVFNLLGQLIKSEEMGNTQIKLDLDEAKSYFFVKLTNETKQKVFKVLLK